MDSVNVHATTEKQSEELEVDFVGGAGAGADASSPHPRLSLIELILPFAEDSKSIVNHDGLLPWQLAQSETIAAMMQPTVRAVKLPSRVTAS